MPQRKIMRIHDYVNQIPDSAAVSSSAALKLGCRSDTK